MNKIKSKIVSKLGLKKSSSHATVWLVAMIVTLLITLIGAPYFMINIIRDIEIVNSKTSSNNILFLDIKNIDSLGKNINALQTDANLLKLVANPNDTVFNVINNAMPNEEDATALASMVQKNIFGGTGVTVEQVLVGINENGENDRIDINFTVGGSFEQIIKAQQRLENSIRPIVVKSLNISKSGDKYMANYAATTFYIPIVEFMIDEEIIAGERIPFAELINPEIVKPNTKVFGENAINPNAWKQQGVGDGSVQ